MAIKQLEPYVNELKEEDSYVEKVNPKNSDIGANAAGMPKGGKNAMVLQHVGGSIGGDR